MTMCGLSHVGLRSKQFVVAVIVSHLRPHNSQEVTIGFNLLGNAFWNAVLEPDLLQLLEALFIQYKRSASPVNRKKWDNYSTKVHVAHMLLSTHTCISVICSV